MKRSCRAESHALELGVAPACATSSPAAGLFHAKPAERRSLHGRSLRWLDSPDAADFDVLAAYYGSSERFACPLCVRVVRARGGPWRIVHDLAHSDWWGELAAGYSCVWVANDDLVGVLGHAGMRSTQK